MPDAAWLPDPTGRFQYRYWDGSRWLAADSTHGSQQSDALSSPRPPSVAAAATAPPASTAGSSASPGAPASTDWRPGLRVAVLGSAAGLLVGTCLTWVKASAGGFT